MLHCNDAEMRLKEISVLHLQCRIPTRSSSVAVLLSRKYLTKTDTFGIDIENTVANETTKIQKLI